MWCVVCGVGCVVWGVWCVVCVVWGVWKGVGVERLGAREGARTNRCRGTYRAPVMVTSVGVRVPQAVGDTPVTLGGCRRAARLYWVTTEPAEVVMTTAPSSAEVEHRSWVWACMTQARHTPFPPPHLGLYKKA